MLEKKLAELKELKEKNEPIGLVLKQVIVALCAEEVGMGGFGVSVLIT